MPEVVVEVAEEAAAIELVFSVDSSWSFSRSPSGGLVVVVASASQQRFLSATVVLVEEASLPRLERGASHPKRARREGEQKERRVRTIEEGRTFRN